MQRQFARGGVRFWAVAGAVALALAGCAPNSEDISATMMADPLKYEFYDCKQLEDFVRATSLQEQKLRGLIAKAEQDTGGTIVAALAYRNDYAKVRADLKLLRATQQRRDCIKQTERDGLGAVH
jgi:hypothetical protein